MNIVFIGHVDAGKSTTGGQILYLTVSVCPYPLVLSLDTLPPSKFNNVFWYVSAIVRLEDTLTGCHRVSGRSGRADNSEI